MWSWKCLNCATYPRLMNYVASLKYFGHVPTQLHKEWQRMASYFFNTEHHSSTPNACPHRCWSHDGLGSYIEEITWSPSCMMETATSHHIAQLN